MIIKSSRLGITIDDARVTITRPERSDGVWRADVLHRGRRHVAEGPDFNAAMSALVRSIDPSFEDPAQAAGGPPQARRLLRLVHSRR